jgi:hypothetical protein
LLVNPVPLKVPPAPLFEFPHPLAVQLPDMLAAPVEVQV